MNTLPVRKRLKILFVAPEMHPYLKTGGLADVAASLPRAMHDLGHDVRTVIPRYKIIDLPLKYVVDFGVPLGKQRETCVLKRDPAAPFPAYFVENYRFFDRDGIYGENGVEYTDNGQRFGFFCRAVLEMCQALKWYPDVIHLNDWQTGLIPVYLKSTLAGHPAYSRIRTLFTLHNMAYQGVFSPETLPKVGLNGFLYNTDCLEYYGNVSFLKGGLVFSDVVTTVSPTYAKEIQTHEFGFGMEGVLHKRKDRLFGVLNGADYEVWNPEKDPHLFGVKYSARDLGGKEEIKRRVLHGLGLPYRESTPLLGMIMRLVDQKGVDLIAEVLGEILQWDLQILILGAGFGVYEDLFRQASRQHAGKMAALIKFDEVWAHRLEAASDFFLMPSRYEPCGLNQFYSLRYGTIPIVRQTGGLADTVSDFRTDPSKGNGLVFSQYSAWAFQGAILAALDLFKNREMTQRIRLRGMDARFSWETSAQQYLKLYDLSREPVE